MLCFLGFVSFHVTGIFIETWNSLRLGMCDLEKEGRVVLIKSREKENVNERQGFEKKCVTVCVCV